MKKIVIAPDSFKGSLTSIEVANAIAEGVKKVYPNCEIIKTPIADGGEGTLNTIVNALKGEKVKVNAHDSLMRSITAEYGLVNNGETAVIEVASINGITLLSEEEQNPLITTTYGTGEIIKDALQRGCRSFIIGIGGSATNDAGTGLLQALGYRFLDKNKKETNGTGQSLQSICSVDELRVTPELKDAHFTIASDVNNPFTGPKGASNIYAPQKGADKEMIEELENGMENFRQLIKKEKGIDLNTTPGTGAAGGLGGGLIAFLNAQLKPGIEMVLQAIDFDKHLQNTDLVITGEGKLDKQTAMGKAAGGVLDAAKKKNIPVIAIGGSVEDSNALIKRGFTSVFSIISRPISIKEAMNKEYTKSNITQTIEQIMRTIYQFA